MLLGLLYPYFYLYITPHKSIQWIIQLLIRDSVIGLLLN